MGLGGVAKKSENGFKCSHGRSVVSLTVLGVVCLKNSRFNGEFLMMVESGVVSYFSDFRDGAGGVVMVETPPYLAVSHSYPFFCRRRRSSVALSFEPAAARAAANCDIHSSLKEECWDFRPYGSK